MKCTQINQKTLTANFHNMSRGLALSNYPKGWKQLAMINEELDKINTASNIDVVKKIMS
jgi:hypothetical protein